MTTLIRRTRLARVSGLALTLVLAGQCQLPTSAQQLPAGTAAQPAPAPVYVAPPPAPVIAPAPLPPKQTRG